jgi:uncharacterized protein (TIGR03437 family)
MHSRFSLWLLAAVILPVAVAQPRITAVQNNYSNLYSGLPNSGLAQGSIIAIYGAGLATGTSVLQGVPLPSTLNGASVAVTVNGVTTRAVLYYASPTQIVAILPSSTPTGGNGQLVVTVNGQPSAPSTLAVVQSNFGMLTLDQAGNGPAAAFDVNSNYLSLTNAANPGDFITLWGSGVGAVTGDESALQTPVNLTSIPMTVWIGGVSATIQYRGRSVYPGLDQINVVVPAGVSGCYVSVAVRSGANVSNIGTIPVAASGRVCSESTAGVTADQVQKLAARSAFSTGSIELSSQTFGQSVEDDQLSVGFGRYTAAQFAANPGGPSLGSCTVYTFRNTDGSLASPIQPAALNAGTLTANAPQGSATLPFQDGGYSLSFHNGLQQGTYNITAAGGPDIGPFTAPFTIPSGGGHFTWSTAGNVSSAVRGQGLTISWPNPGAPAGSFVRITGTSAAGIGGGPVVGATFFCAAPADAGRFTIPPEVLLSLPISGAGVGLSSLAAGLYLAAQTFTAPGLDVGVINVHTDSGIPFNFQ